MDFSIIYINIVDYFISTIEFLWNYLLFVITVFKKFKYIVTNIKLIQVYIDYIVYSNNYTLLYFV